jgi:hypothetical protein
MQALNKPIIAAATSAMELILTPGLMGSSLACAAPDILVNIEQLEEVDERQIRCHCRKQAGGPPGTQNAALDALTPIGRPMSPRTADSSAAFLESWEGNSEKDEVARPHLLRTTHG